MSFLNTWRPEFVIIMLISSANIIGLDISDMILDRPLIYKRKNKGPSTEPWGTPCLTVCWNQGECICTFLKAYIRHYIICIFCFEEFIFCSSYKFSSVPHTSALYTLYTTSLGIFFSYASNKYVKKHTLWNFPQFYHVHNNLHIKMTTVECFK